MSVGLKEFWDDWEDESNLLDYEERRIINKLRKNQGEFFWGRGGKQFVLDFIEMQGDKQLKYIIGTAKMFFEQGNCSFENHDNAQDFLDCLACLGEDKVKELIKEVKE